ncbi:hypothetical protein HU200_007772 [Digitaria exilis]|uniref:Uncharacterized protein n=1 Tax=Digitaria exilis TaxID=1010633 RepID=A0A835KSB9_9POAL|nr:hypothetical protein HU200_007772 [Digitaria exilis]
MDAEAGEAGMKAAGAAEASTSGAAAPFGRSSSRLSVPGAESFDGALRVCRAARLASRACSKLTGWWGFFWVVQELKDLRSQLHEAADCCEKAFIKTEKKKMILEGTKSYICDAVVAVIDHLGTVSSKLEHKLQEKTDVSQAERKINFLKQVGTLSMQRTNEENGASSSKNDQEVLKITGPTLSGASFTLKPYDVQVQPSIGKEQTTAPASFDDSPSPRTLRRSFSFRAEDVHIILGDHKKKANHGSNILSFLKKTRRHP